MLLTANREGMKIRGRKEEKDKTRKAIKLEHR